MTSTASGPVGSGPAPKNFKNMTLAEAIVSTRAEMYKRQKMCEEMVAASKERVAEMINSFNAMNKRAMKKDMEANDMRFDTSKLFDYGVESWNHRNEKEGIGNMKIYTEIYPWLHERIDAVGEVTPEVKITLQKMLVDYRRMKVHDDLLQNESVQHLEDVRMWMSGLDDGCDDEDMAESKANQVYMAGKKRLMQLKTLQGCVKKIADDYHVSCKEEVAKLKATEQIIKAKQEALRTNKLNSELKVTKDTTAGDVAREGYELLAQNEKLDSKISTVKRQIQEKEKAIEEIDGQYKYALEEKKRRVTIFATSIMNEHKISVVTEISQNLEKMNVLCLKPQLEKEASDVRRMNALSDEINKMAAFFKKSDTKVIDDRADSSDTFRKCNNILLKQKLEKFIQHIDKQREVSWVKFKTLKQQLSTELNRQPKPKVKPMTSSEFSARFQSLTHMIQDPRQINQAGLSFIQLGKTMVDQLSRILTSDKLRVLEETVTENEYLSNVVEFLKKIKIKDNTPMTSKSKKDTDSTSTQISRKISNPSREISGSTTKFKAMDKVKSVDNKKIEHGGKGYATEKVKTTVKETTKHMSDEKFQVEKIAKEKESTVKGRERERFNVNEVETAKEKEEETNKGKGKAIAREIEKETESGSENKPETEIENETTMERINQKAKEKVVKTAKENVAETNKGKGKTITRETEKETESGSENKPETEIENETTIERINQKVEIKQIDSDTKSNRKSETSKETKLYTKSVATNDKAEEQFKHSVDTKKLDDSMSKYSEERKGRNTAAPKDKITDNVIETRDEEDGTKVKEGIAESAHPYGKVEKVQTMEKYEYGDRKDDKHGMYEDRYREDKDDRDDIEDRKKFEIQRYPDKQNKHEQTDDNGKETERGRMHFDKQFREDRISLELQSQQLSDDQENIHDLLQQRKSTIKTVGFLNEDKDDTKPPIIVAWKRHSSINRQDIPYLQRRSQSIEKEQETSISKEESDGDIKSLPNSDKKPNTNSMTKHEKENMSSIASYDQQDGEVRHAVRQEEELNHQETEERYVQKVQTEFHDVKHENYDDKYNTKEQETLTHPVIIVCSEEEVKQEYQENDGDFKSLPNNDENPNKESTTKHKKKNMNDIASYDQRYEEEQLAARQKEELKLQETKQRYKQKVEKDFQDVKHENSGYKYKPRKKLKHPKKSVSSEGEVKHEIINAWNGLPMKANERGTTKEKQGSLLGAGFSQGFHVKGSSFTDEIQEFETFSSDTQSKQLVTETQRDSIGRKTRSKQSDTESKRDSNDRKTQSEQSGIESKRDSNDRKTQSKQSGTESKRDSMDRKSKSLQSGPESKQRDSIDRKTKSVQSGPESKHNSIDRKTEKSKQSGPGSKRDSIDTKERSKHSGPESKRDSIDRRTQSEHSGLESKRDSIDRKTQSKQSGQESKLHSIDRKTQSKKSGPESKFDSIDRKTKSVLLGPEFKRDSIDRKTQSKQPGPEFKRDSIDRKTQSKQSGPESKRDSINRKTQSEHSGLESKRDSIYRKTQSKHAGPESKRDAVDKKTKSVQSGPESKRDSNDTKSQSKRLALRANEGSTMKDLYKQQGKPQFSQPIKTKLTVDGFQKDLCVKGVSYMDDMKESKKGANDTKPRSKQTGSKSLKVSNNRKILSKQLGKTPELYIDAQKPIYFSDGKTKRLKKEEHMMSKGFNINNLAFPLLFTERNERRDDHEKTPQIIIDTSRISDNVSQKQGGVKNTTNEEVSIQRAKGMLEKIRKDTENSTKNEHFPERHLVEFQQERSSFDRRNKIPNEAKLGSCLKHSKFGTVPKDSKQSSHISVSNKSNREQTVRTQDKIQQYQSEKTGNGFEHATNMSTLEGRAYQDDHILVSSSSTNQKDAVTTKKDKHTDQTINTNKKHGSIFDMSIDETVNMLVTHGTKGQTFDQSTSTTVDRLPKLPKLSAATFTQLKRGKKVKTFPSTFQSHTNVFNARFEARRTMNSSKQLKTEMSPSLKLAFVEHDIPVYKNVSTGQLVDKHGFTFSSSQTHLFQLDRRVTTDNLYLIIGPAYRCEKGKSCETNKINSKTSL